MNEIVRLFNSGRTVQLRIEYTNHWILRHYFQTVAQRRKSFDVKDTLLVYGVDVCTHDRIIYLMFRSS